eukprot:TRINITY_DN4186_c0_g2_i2.p2 TRINITY_DN4186_c0_g2~~TRINITY_DN4186_c0_g2_i2.p2  ORF type:complete len:373 (+),score=96.12 TRINITY_DN4186_c0_g2_i2:129-1247(+)
MFHTWHKRQFADSTTHNTQHKMHQTPPGSHGAYPPSHGHPSQGGYPPQQGGYPPQQHGGAYPPQQQGAYPPQQGGYPPQQHGGAYPPQQQGYPPQQHGGAYPPQQHGGAYPPQQHGGAYPPQYGQGQPQQGYGQQQPQAWFSSYYPHNNPQLLNQVQGWFASVDTDRSGTLNQVELGKALEQAGLKYSTEVLTKILRTFDVYRTGSLRVFEFVCLYSFLSQIRNAFVQFDSDRSGTLDWAELGRVLVASGFNLNPPSITALATKFDPARKGGVNLEQYTDMALFLANLKNFFDFYAQQGGGAHGAAGGGAKVKKDKKDKKDKKGSGPASPAHHGTPGYGTPPASSSGGAHGALGGSINITFDQLVSAVPYFA